MRKVGNVLISGRAERQISWDSFLRELLPHRRAAVDKSQQSTQNHILQKLSKLSFRLVDKVSCKWIFLGVLKLS